MCFTSKRWRRRAATVWLTAGLGLSGLNAAWAQIPDPQTAAQGAALDNGAVVLMYHRFGEDSLPSTSVRLAQFDAHIEELTSGRYQVMPLPEILDRLRAGEALPPRALAITIDDAALSVYQEAWPRLKAHNLPFTVFVSTEAPDLRLPSYMSWAQLREISADPLVTIGNHGHAHAHMAWLSPAAQRADIDKAAARLAAELGTAPKVFAYPYGEISLALRRTVADAGFAAAFGQHSGAIGEISDRLTLPRFPLNESYGELDRFRLVTNALPLPVDGITPAEMSVAEAGQNPPNFGFTVASALEDLGGLNCFASAGDPLITRLDKRIELRFSTPLPAGRTRINCTLRAAGGRWRWFGTQFIVAEEAAR
ncbi:MAG: polysaccharide deacetylase family protein [Kiloniellaceae bacterium]